MSRARGSILYFGRLLADPEFDLGHFVAIILSNPEGDWRHPQLVGWIITSMHIRRAAIVRAQDGR